MLAFVWSFVFGSRLRRSRTLAGFRRSYNSTANKTLSPGGFYQRLTPILAEYLCDLVEHGLNEVAVLGTVDANLSRFRNVMVADGTILRLHRFLADDYEPRRWEQGGERLHLLHNFTNHTIEQFSLTDEKRTTARSSTRDRGSKTG